MAAYTSYPNGVSTTQALRTGSQAAPEVFFMQQTFDASLLNLTTSDTAQLFTLVDGMFIDEVTVEILTADAGGGGITLGDGAQAAGYGAYATLSAAGKLAIAAGSATTYLYTVTTNAKVKPKLITSAANDKKILMAVTSATLTTLKVRVTVKGFFA